MRLQSKVKKKGGERGIVDKWLHDCIQALHKSFLVIASELSSQSPPQPLLLTQRIVGVPPFFICFDVTCTVEQSRSVSMYGLGFAG
jgi:hypothetical protein